MENQLLKESNTANFPQDSDVNGGSHRESKGQSRNVYDRPQQQNGLKDPPGMSSLIRMVLVGGSQMVGFSEKLMR
jgi:hypothetical protein